MPKLIIAGGEEDAATAAAASEEKKHHDGTSSSYYQPGLPMVNPQTDPDKNDNGGDDTMADKNDSSSTSWKLVCYKFKTQSLGHSFLVNSWQIEERAIAVWCVWGPSFWGRHPICLVRTVD